MIIKRKSRKYRTEPTHQFKTSIKRQAFNPEQSDFFVTISPKYQCCRPDQSQLREQISSLAPFSLLDYKKSIDSELNEVVDSYKKASDKTLRLQSAIKSHDNKKVIKKRVDDTKALFQNCKQIIRRTDDNFRYSKGYIQREGKRSRTVQESYDETECQLARQMIAEAKLQRKQFKQTRNRFKKLMYQVGTSFADHVNLNISSRKMKEINIGKLIHGEQVSNDYKDEVFYITETKRYSERNRYNFGKEINIYSKGTNRVINVEKLNRQLKKENEELKVKFLRESSIKRGMALHNSNNTLYSRYFKGSRSRREMLCSSSANFTE